MVREVKVTGQAISDVDLARGTLGITVQGCSECGALVMIRFSPGGGQPGRMVEIDNYEFHRRWHEQQEA